VEKAPGQKLIDRRIPTVTTTAPSLAGPHITTFRLHSRRLLLQKKTQYQKKKEGRKKGVIKKKISISLRCCAFDARQESKVNHQGRSGKNKIKVLSAISNNVRTGRENEFPSGRAAAAAACTGTPPSHLGLACWPLCCKRTKAGVMLA
jgi:hypothetical protein